MSRLVSFVIGENLQPCKDVPLRSQIEKLAIIVQTRLPWRVSFAESGALT